MGRLKCVVCCFLMLGTTASLAESFMQQPLGIRDATHLLQRTGIGSDPLVVRELASLARADAIDLIVSSVRQQPTLPMPLWVNQNAPPFWARGDMKREDRRAFNRARNREVAELRRWWVAEMITTTSPQTERLVLLWHNHFVSAFSGIDEESTSIARQNQMFRDLGLGNFRDFLKAVIRDTAMLNYLDNRSNKKNSPNENLARELLELFTMGEGEFDEHTVKEAARALTGWTVSVPNNMTFSIAHWDQDKGNKTLFGRSGSFDGDDLIDLILEQPAAARHLARVFWRNFVSEFIVDEDAIAILATTFRESNFELEALYRAVLESAAFWDDEYRGHIVKSPVDLLIGTIRTTGVVPKRWQAIPAELDNLGQALFDPPNVAGWKGGRNWITPDRLLSRRAALNSLFHPRLFKRKKNGRIGKDEGLISSAIGSDNMMSGSMMSGDLMASKDVGMGMLSMPQNLSLTLASEDYEGSPRAKVILRSHDSIVWDSGEFLLPEGHDTERLGRMRNDDVIPWQRIDFTLPDTVTDIQEIEIHFLNDDAGESGDRNLFVDMVNVRGMTYLARTGKQESRCPPNNAEEAGNLYCDGKVIIPTAIADPVESPDRQQMIVADAYMHWFQGLKQGANRRQMSIGLKDLQFGARHWDTFVFDVVSTRDLGPGLEISSDGCLEACFIEWPECAWTNETNIHARSVFFPLDRDQVDAEIHCHWDSLRREDKQLVSSLFSLLPEIVSAVGDGRKAQRRQALYDGWSNAINDGMVKLDVVYDVDGAATEFVTTGYNAASSTPPLLLDRPKAAARAQASVLGVLQELIDSGGEQMPAVLAIAPVGELSGEDVVPAIFSDPAYQVR